MGLIDDYKQNKREQREAKKAAKAAGKGRLRTKLEMYDWLLANIRIGKAIVPYTGQKLGGGNVHIGYSTIESETEISKYYMIVKLPDYIVEHLFDEIRAECVAPGLKIDFYCESVPYKVNWDSPEMRNRMTIWRRYTADMGQKTSVFDYRNNRDANLAKKRIVESTQYLNEADLEYKRTTMKTLFIIKVTGTVNGPDDTDGIINMEEAIVRLRRYCLSQEIVIKEMKNTMMDWVRAISPTCMSISSEIDKKLSRKVMVDDTLAVFNSFKQGRVGTTGAMLGIDIKGGVPILHKFREDPEAAENWLITGETGSGKSYFVKTLITYLLAEQIVVSVLDYEGDEYTSLANYIRSGRPEDVKIVSMGKGSTVYFDPCEIPELTGDEDIDMELKETAVGFILSIFRLIVGKGVNGMTTTEEWVVTTAVQRMYDSVGVTEDMETWHRSKGLRLSDVYEEMRIMHESKELLSSDGTEDKQLAAMKILEATAPYFEPGAAKSYVFRHPMPADELYEARFIIFSFGMRGAGDSTVDPVILALKQLSVSFVTIQISNYCKYVRHCFNAKIFEEFQRYGQCVGSAEVISNVITGGRKRGDINFILTNDLAAILRDDVELNVRIRENIQNYAVGRIKSKKVREDFCKKFSQLEMLPDLDRIAAANKKTKTGSEKKAMGSKNKYQHAFAIILDSGKRAISRVYVPQSIIDSRLFDSAVDTSKGNIKEEKEIRNKGIKTKESSK